MLKPHPLSCAVFLLALCAGHAWSAAPSQFEEDFDDIDKPWQEITVQLPKVPNGTALLPFYVSPTATQRFSIAPDSLNVGSDGVIRYVMVSKSDNGAENISYEGLRCATLQKKLYAFGHKDGTWTRSRHDSWEPLAPGNANRQHAALADSAFCDGRIVAGDAASMLKRLRTKAPLYPVTH